MFLTSPHIPTNPDQGESIPDSITVALAAEKSGQVVVQQVPVYEPAGIGESPHIQTLPGNTGILSGIMPIQQLNHLSYTPIEEAPVIPTAPLNYANLIYNAANPPQQQTISVPVLTAPPLMGGSYS